MIKPTTPKFEIGQTLTALEQFGTNSPLNEASLHVGDTAVVKECFQLDNQPDVNIYSCEGYNGFMYDIREDLAIAAIPKDKDGKIVFDYSSTDREKTNFELRFFELWTPSILEPILMTKDKYAQLSLAVKSAIFDFNNRTLTVDTIRHDNIKTVIDDLVTCVIREVIGVIVKKRSPDGNWSQALMVSFKDTDEPWTLVMKIDGEEVDINE